MGFVEINLAASLPEVLFGPSDNRVSAQLAIHAEHRLGCIRWELKMTKSLEA